MSKKPRKQRENPARTYTEADLHEAELAHSRAHRAFERAVKVAQEAQNRANEASAESAKAAKRVDEIEAALAEQGDEAEA